MCLGVAVGVCLVRAGVTGGMQRTVECSESQRHDSTSFGWTCLNSFHTTGRGLCFLDCLVWM